MTKNYVFTTNDVKWIKKQTNKSSNNLVDILDDKKKVANLNKDYHYRPGISKTVENNLFNLAVKLINLYSLKKKDEIVGAGGS